MIIKERTGQSLEATLEIVDKTDNTVLEFVLFDVYTIKCLL